MFHRLVSFLALGAALAAPVWGASHVLQVDPEATQVSFLLPATGHDVEGLLHLRAGRLELNPETGAATGELTLDATLTESGNKKRDKTMHKKVLESEEYPLITFHPQHWSGELATSGTSEITIEGTVSIHGSDHPLSLPTTVEVDGEHWHGKTTFSVPFVEWGMHDPSMFLLKVAKEVEVSVEADGAFAAPMAMASAGSKR